MAKNEKTTLPTSMLAVLAAHAPPPAPQDLPVDPLLVQINPTRDITPEQLDKLQAASRDDRPLPTFDTSEANVKLREAHESALNDALNTIPRDGDPGIDDRVRNTPKPSLGRVVIFHASDTLHYMAHVCNVHTDSVVTLDVVNHHGHHIAIERSSYGSGPRQWSWPTRV
jgi:hypothetical protein